MLRNLYPSKIVPSFARSPQTVMGESYPHVPLVLSPGRQCRNRNVCCSGFTARMRSFVKIEFRKRWSPPGGEGIYRTRYKCINPALQWYDRNWLKKNWTSYSIVPCHEKHTNIHELQADFLEIQETIEDGKLAAQGWLLRKYWPSRLLTG